MILSASPFSMSLIEPMFEEKKTKEPNAWFKLLFLCGLCLFFISCAAKPQRHFSYDPSANASDEIRNLQTEMAQAEREQIGVLSPKNYVNASNSLEKAKKLQAKGESNEKVLKELGNARGFFEQAKDTAVISQKAMPEVLDARENALIAGAALHERPALKDVDRKLADYTEEFEKGKAPKVSLSQKENLQNQYLNLELKSIKDTRLADIQGQIDSAKKMGAARYAPKTLAQAQEKLRAAEVDINTDRHNDAKITASANEAQRAAQRLMKVTELSRKSGKPGSEDLAIGIVDRDERLNALREQQMQEQAQLQQARRQQEALRSQQATQLSEAQRQAQEAQQKLAAQQKVEEAYRQAQNQFSKDEAQVFRQGDNLILRMRSVKFPSGRSDIPASAFATLNKVRSVIDQMNAQQVVVEGNTDSVGDPDFNMDLSQQRAESVAQYLRNQPGSRLSGASESGVTIEAKGLGDQNPVSTNKSKEGRALNRRVDIIISPNMTVDSAEQPEDQSNQ